MPHGHQTLNVVTPKWNWKGTCTVVEDCSKCGTKWNDSGGVPYLCVLSGLFLHFDPEGTHLNTLSFAIENFDLRLSKGVPLSPLHSEKWDHAQIRLKPVGDRSVNSLRQNDGAVLAV
mmetsp:Transcript_22659/g.42559  ORF Transcript_22659/g.42559 Transcript_22659/m.42559 type:complete len:117 (-) Transcript_22659:282-632(-)